MNYRTTLLAGSSHGIRLAVVGIAVSIVACARTTATGPTVTVPPAAPAVPRETMPNALPLPPVPRIVGAPLAVRVQYPAENQVIASRDSNFVLGTVGSGDATLILNGVSVPVAPNGAFIAWVGNPPAGRPQYDFLVVRGTDTVRRTVPIRYPTPRSPLLATGPLRVDSGSVQPSTASSARLRYRRDEAVRVGVRAPSNARVWLDLANGTRQQPLVIGAQTQAAVLAASGVASPNTPIVDPNGDVGVSFATDVPAVQLDASARLVIARGADTVRFALAKPQFSDTGVVAVGVLRNTSTIGSDTDRVVIGRPTVDGTYKWLLLPGTIVEITGVQGTFTRVRLDRDLEVWVASDDIITLPQGTPLPRRVTGGFRVTPSRDWVDVQIGTGDRPAYYIDADERTLTLTLYRTQAAPEISPILGNDTLVRRMDWEQVTSDRLRITFTLSQPVYGWLALWDDARRNFVLRIRRIPKIDAARPLAGLTIAVDAGHPPAGATGPTGVYEGDAVLPVAEIVASMLRERGATPVMTRTTLAPLGLTERTVISRRANAHAFVSIHLNALPDGVNPFTNNGTSTLFFHQPSEPLARPVQRALMQRLGLRDLGVHYQNLAVARPTWYPSVLTEGAFVMMPEQEAAIMNPEYRRRYAEGIVAGLEQYFRELARR